MPGDVATYTTATVTNQSHGDGGREQRRHDGHGAGGDAWRT